jgi:hypothetical protein
MRYIPMSTYSFDEIVEQCRNAINKAPKETPDFYDEVCEFEEWESKFAVTVW